MRAVKLFAVAFAVLAMVLISGCRFDQTIKQIDPPPELPPLEALNSNK